MLPDEVRKAVEEVNRSLHANYMPSAPVHESLQAIRAHLLAREAEVEALRTCAIKYLGWLDVQDPASGLESDLRNPDMCGTAHLSENSRG